MNNRRPTGTDASNSYYKKKYVKKDGEQSSGDRHFQPREGRYAAHDNQASSREGNRPRRDFQSGPGNSRIQPKGKFTPKNKNPKPWEKEKVVKIVSDLQVTDGKHKGRYLKKVQSQKFRPTDRRVREAMFRILFRRVKAGRFLDLCSGGGTVGIEAISRGALIATFVERSAKMCSSITENMKTLEIKDGHGEIFESECVPFLKQMEKRKRFWDVIYFDPPLDADYDEVLDYFRRGVVIKPRGVLVIEHHAEMFFPEEIGVMKRWRVVVQDETALSFYDRK